MSDDHRTETTLTGTEREQVEAFVHDNRLEIVGLLDGLTEEQARRRLVPSLTTLLGLVKHAIFVEKVWFHVALGGHTRSRARPPERPARQLRARRVGHDRIGARGLPTGVGGGGRDRASYDLDDLALHNRRGPLTLRWIYVHLVEELARHAGHGDILREQVLAADQAESVD